MNRKLTFIAMYRALDCLYEESPNEIMREFLSEADPYIFTDRESADPAIGVEFADMWTNCSLSDDISVSEAYTFVKNFTFFRNKNEYLKKVIYKSSYLNFVLKLKTRRDYESGSGRK